MNPEPTPLDPLVHNPPSPSSGPAGAAIGERVQPRNKAELRLPYSPQYPRVLNVELSAGGYIWANVRSKQYVTLCSTNVPLSGCYLDVSVHGCEFLVVGDAVFLLSIKEAAQIRATFEPLGLRIRETDA
jgi:hypothetical protein